MSGFDQSYRTDLAIQRDKSEARAYRVQAGQAMGRGIAAGAAGGVSAYQQARAQAFQEQAQLARMELLARQQERDEQIHQLQMIRAVDEQTGFKLDLDAKKLQLEASRWQFEQERKKADGASREEFNYFTDPENRILYGEDGKPSGVIEYKDGRFVVNDSPQAAQEFYEANRFGERGLSQSAVNVQRRSDQRVRMAGLQQKARDLQGRLENEVLSPQERETLQAELESVRQQFYQETGVEAPQGGQDGAQQQPQQQPQSYMGALRNLLSPSVAAHSSLQPGGAIDQLYGAIAMTGMRTAEVDSKFVDTYQSAVQVLGEMGMDETSAQTKLSQVLSAPGPYLDRFLLSIGVPYRAAYDAWFGPEWRATHRQMAQAYGDPWSKRK